MTYGIWVENKLGERDERGHPKHNLKQLLGIEEPSDYPGMNQAAVEFLRMIQSGKLR